MTAKSIKIDPPIAQPNAVFFGEDTLTGQAAQQNWRYQPDGTEEKLQQWAINVTTKEEKTFAIAGVMEGLIN